jgi:hypothetical protein
VARDGRAAREPRGCGAGQRHKTSAGDYYLRAGIYHYNAERFITPGPEKRVQGERAYHCWHTGIRLREPSIEFVEVPYEGTTLPRCS